MFTCMLGYGMFLVRRPRLFIDLLRCRSHQLSSVQRLSSTLIPVKELHKDTQRMFMMISVGVGDSAGFGSVPALMSAVTFSGPFEVLPGSVSDGCRFTAIFEESDPLMWFSYADT